MVLTYELLYPKNLTRSISDIARAEMRTPALYMKYSLSEVHKTILITTYLQVYFFCEQILNERHVGQSTHAPFSFPEPLGLICN